MENQTLIDPQPAYNLYDSGQTRRGVIGRLVSLYLLFFQPDTLREVLLTQATGDPCSNEQGWQVGHYL